MQNAREIYRQQHKTTTHMVRHMSTTDMDWQMDFDTIFCFMNVILNRSINK